MVGLSVIRQGTVIDPLVSESVLADCRRSGGGTISRSEGAHGSLDFIGESIQIDSAWPREEEGPPRALQGQIRIVLELSLETLHVYEYHRTLILDGTSKLRQH